MSKYYYNLPGINGYKIHYVDTSHGEDLDAGRYIVQYGLNFIKKFSNKEDAYNWMKNN